MNVLDKALKYLALCIEQTRPLRAPEHLAKHLLKLRHVCQVMNGNCHQETDAKGKVISKWAPVICDSEDGSRDVR